MINGTVMTIMVLTIDDQSWLVIEGVIYFQQFDNPYQLTTIIDDDNHGTNLE